MSGYQQSSAGQHGYALSVERVIDAPPEAIFDAFVALYDSQRPDWVTGSQLDLRPGGRWSVAFQVPNGPAFREERTITAVERPRMLAYDMTAVYPDVPGFDTTVQVTSEAVPQGHRVRLVQRGFPHDQRPRRLRWGVARRPCRAHPPAGRTTAVSPLFPETGRDCPVADKSALSH